MGSPKSVKHPGRGTRPGSSGPWLFFALTYGFSWVLWIAAALIGRGTSSPPVTFLYILGGFGPPLAGIYLTYRSRDLEERRDYWQRVIDFRRIGKRWYAVTLLSMPSLTLLAMLLGSSMQGNLAAQFETAQHFLSTPLSLMSFTLGTLLFGPLPEELGWRGYALGRSQEQHNALVSSLIVGMGWSLWHLPIYFIPGTYQYQLGFGSTLFWLFSLGMIPQSILMTWIYNNNRRSTLSAILFHFTINFSGEFFAPATQARIYQFVLLCVAAVVITILWGPKTLAKSESQKSVDGQPLC